MLRSCVDLSISCLWWLVTFGRLLFESACGRVVSICHVFVAIAGVCVSSRGRVARRRLFPKSSCLLSVKICVALLHIVQCQKAHVCLRVVAVVYASRSPSPSSLSNAVMICGADSSLPRNMIASCGEGVAPQFTSSRKFTSPSTSLRPVRGFAIP